MRVLFIPQWYPPRDGHNNIQGTYCREHVRAASLYDDVAVLAYSSRSDYRPTLGWERVDDFGIPTFYGNFGQSPVPKTTYPFFLWHLRRATYRVLQEWGRPDIIHTQDIYAYYVIKCARSLGIPFVISQHWTGFLRNSLSRKEIRQFRWAFAQAALIFPANEFAARDYARYGITTPTSWLPNALDTTIFYPPPRDERQPALLHISGFTPQKRFPDIVRAFAAAQAERPETILHVVGDGRGRSEMEALAKRELPPGTFHFHGLLAKPRIADLLRRARGLIFPSEAETFGCVLMEAMACGCPVLTTRVGGIPAVVREGDGLFVKVGDIDAIASNMIRLVDNAHSLDVARISRETQQRFGHETVGRLLHEKYLRASAADASR
jgi:glycosyltransferase involved in cell wall biosynthesis